MSRSKRPRVESPAEQREPDKLVLQPMPEGIFTATDLKTHHNSLSRVGRQILVDSEYPSCGAVKMHVPCLKNRFYEKIKAHVSDRPYDPKRIRHEQYALNKELGWVFRETKSRKKRIANPNISVRLAQMKTEYDKMKNMLNDPVPENWDLKVVDRYFRYYESMLVAEPIFEDVYDVDDPKGDLVPELPAIMQNIDFNDGLGDVQWELHSQLLAAGDGLSRHWFYLKSILTATIWHFEAFLLGSVNVYGGLGFALWYVTSPNDKDKVLALYRDMEMKTANQDKEVFRFDFYTKNSGPTVQHLLDSGIQVYYTFQRDGDAIVTYANCLHAVYNFGVGFATARNFIHDMTIEYLRHELDLVRSSAALQAMFQKAKQYAFMESLYQMVVARDALSYAEHYQHIMIKNAASAIRLKDKFDPTYVNLMAFKDAKSLKAITQSTSKIQVLVPGTVIEEGISDGVDIARMKHNCIPSFRCDTCYKVLRSTVPGGFKSVLTSHRDGQHKPVRCQHCGLDKPGRNSLTKHQLEWTCPHCGDTTYCRVTRWQHKCDMTLPVVQEPVGEPAAAEETEETVVSEEFDVSGESEDDQMEE